MSKKDLNPESVINELRGESVFFKPDPEPAPPPITQPQEVKGPAEEPQPETVRLSERNSERTEIRSSVLPTKRLSRRYSFEFYDDQITKLKTLKHEAEMRGEKLSLSDIARQAMDDYLRDK